MLIRTSNHILKYSNQKKVDLYWKLVSDYKELLQNYIAMIHSKKFNNKLQRWSYAKTLNKLELLAQTKGFCLRFINPAYTSQTCSHCGVVMKSNRNGEIYHCSVCGVEIDADVNAAINILRRGVYSLSNLEN